MNKDRHIGADRQIDTKRVIYIRYTKINKLAQLDKQITERHGQADCHRQTNIQRDGQSGKDKQIDSDI